MRSGACRGQWMGHRPSMTLKWPAMAPSYAFQSCRLHLVMTQYGQQGGLWQFKVWLPLIKYQKKSIKKSKILSANLTRCLPQMNTAENNAYKPQTLHQTINLVKTMKEETMSSLQGIKFHNHSHNGCDYEEGPVKSALGWPQSMKKTKT